MLIADAMEQKSTGTKRCSLNKLKTTKFLRLLRCDILRGTLSRWLLFVFCLSFFAFSSSVFLQKYAQNAHDLQGPNLIECWMYIFQGVQPFDPDNPTSFRISFEWIVLIFLGIFQNIGFAANDGTQLGCKIVLAASNRRLWWLSKCIWIILNSTVFYLSGAIVILFCSIAWGNTSPLASRLTPMAELLTSGLKTLTNQKMLTLFVLPILVVATLSLIALIVSLKIGKTLSLCFIMTYLILSLYFKTPFFIGNDGMFCRSAIFVAFGVPVYAVLARALCISFSVIVLGAYMFSKQDLFEVK